MPSFDTRSEYFKRLVSILDIALVALTFVVVLRVYEGIRGSEYLDVSAHLGLLPVVLLVFGFARHHYAARTDFRRQTIFGHASGLAKEVLLASSSIVLLDFLLKLTHVSRIFLVSFAVVAFVVLLAVRRFVIWWYLTRPKGADDARSRVLIVGSGRRARMLADQLQRSGVWGAHIVGFLDPRGESAGRRASDEILGHANQITSVLRDNVVEDVIVAVPRSMIGDLQTIIDACQEEGVRLRFMADIYDFDAKRIRMSLVDGIPLLSFESVARAEGPLLAKRIFDIVVTMAALPVLLPIFLAVALAVRLDSKGPIFFVQERVGLNKRLFPMFKFRSMVVDAEEKMAEIEHLNEASGPNFKIQNDPRMTRVGRFIRKTSLDELPQLINVLRGDMSLVGPRPMSVRDVNLFDRGVQRKRFSVRPGITCLWQISGRSDLDFDDWLKLDLKYIDSWSFWQDIRILVKTVPVVLRGSGAA